MIYLDNAATTFPKPEEVYAAMDNANRFSSVNAGRGSYRLARNASNLIAETKNLLRTLVKTVSNTPVIFSPSITVAMNQIVHGVGLRDGAIIYVSPYEHNAVARSLHSVAKNKQYVIKELPIDLESLEIDLEKMKYEFSKERPEMVFCTHVSNVTGYILPVREIFSEAKKHSCITVLDAAQSLGLVEVDANVMNADIIAFAGHKSIYGPFGIGGFINVSDIQLDCLLAGGTGSDSLNLDMPNDMEQRYEPASTNIIAVAGLRAALEHLDREKIYKHERALTTYLIDKISTIKNVRIIYPYKSETHIGILSFTIEKMLSEDVGAILDEDFDIAVRTGFHCAPYIHKYLDDMKTMGTIRVSIGQYTTREDIDALINALEEVSNE